VTAPPATTAPHAAPRVRGPAWVTAAVSGVLLVNGVLSLLLPTVTALRSASTPGDFSALYTGAWMLGHDQGYLLYNLNAQRYAASLWLDQAPPDAWPTYAAPPLLPVALAPVAELGFFWSYGVVALVVLALTALAAARLRAVLPSPSATAARTAALAGILYLPLALTAHGGLRGALAIGLLGLAFAS